MRYVRPYPEGDCRSGHWASLRWAVFIPGIPEQLVHIGDGWLGVDPAVVKVLKQRAIPTLEVDLRDSGVIDVVDALLEPGPQMDDVSLRVGERRVQNPMIRGGRLDLHAERQ